MPYPDGMTSAALDAHNGRDDDDERVAKLIAADQHEAAILWEAIQRAINAAQRAEFKLGWPVRGMDRADVLAALRDCLPQSRRTLLAERTEAARQLIKDGRA